MIDWNIDHSVLGAEARDQFSSLDKVFELNGDNITQDKISNVIRVEADKKKYYVKRYFSGGNHLRRWIGRSRVESEWRNLHLFLAWNIPTARVIAYGQERFFGFFCRGAVITEELTGAIDLARLVKSGHLTLKQKSTFRNLSAQIANIVRLLHTHRFTHNDLHWRNLLFDEINGRVHLIDCPSGAFWWRGPLLDYRIAKNLATLDKSARIYLTHTQRLRFYLDYKEKNKLDTKDKRCIKQIVKAYQHRLRRKGSHISIT